MLQNEWKTVGLCCWIDNKQRWWMTKKNGAIFQNINRNNQLKQPFQKQKKKRKIKLFIDIYIDDYPSIKGSRMGRRGWSRWHAPRSIIVTFSWIRSDLIRIFYLNDNFRCHFRCFWMIGILLRPLALLLLLPVAPTTTAASGRERWKVRTRSEKRGSERIRKRQRSCKRKGRDWESKMGRREGWKGGCARESAEQSGRGRRAVASTISAVGTPATTTSGSFTVDGITRTISHCQRAEWTPKVELGRVESVAVRMRQRGGELHERRRVVWVETRRRDRCRKVAEERRLERRRVWGLTHRRGVIVRRDRRRGGRSRRVERRRRKWRARRWTQWARNGWNTVTTPEEREGRVGKNQRPWFGFGFRPW